MRAPRHPWIAVVAIAGGATGPGPSGPPDRMPLRTRAIDRAVALLEQEAHPGTAAPGAGSR